MSGNLKKCCLALLLPPPDYYAKRLKEAFQGLEAPRHDCQEPRTLFAAKLFCPSEALSRCPELLVGAACWRHPS